MTNVLCVCASHTQCAACGPTTYTGLAAPPFIYVSLTRSRVHPPGFLRSLGPCTREDAPCSTGFSALAALVCPPSRPCWCTRYPARAVELVRRWGSRRWASRMVVCQAPARPNPLSSLSRSHRLPHPPQVTMKFQAGVDWAALDEAGSVAESLAWGTTFGASTSSTTRTRSRSCCSYESELR